MRTDIQQLLLGKYGKHNPAVLNAGNTIRVHQRIKEGDKERVQIFEGLVIAVKHGKSLDGSFTVRKLAANNIGVERIYPLHSPNVVKVELVKTAAVSRAKLYYMRDRLGKAARFRGETRMSQVWDESAVVAIPEMEIEEEVVATDEEVEQVQEVEAPVAEAEVAPEVAVEEAPAEEA